MIEELNIYGIYVPSLLVWMVIASLLSFGIQRALARFDLYKYIWHRPLFDLAMYVIALGAVVNFMTWILA
jgi:hypothetical protein